MSDVADEELLNDEEFDYESYDLGCEEEDALLEEDNKGYGSGDEVDFKRKRKDLEKKDSVSDTDEQEDVLNLDVEDDFQDDDKEETVVKNKKKEGKFVSERTPTSSNISLTKVPPKPLLGKRPLLNTKPTNSDPNQQNKRFQRNIGNRRGRGVGRGNFQQRSTFMRNNNLNQDRRPGRRNGTVFINPKYEGFVQINENNARLAWDNQTYSQNNTSLIPPWNGGNVMGNTNDQSLLINNLVEMITQTPNLLQLPPPPPPPPVLNFEPPPNAYQNQVLFPPITTMQPPPFNNNSQNLLSAQWDDSYNTSNQNQALPPPLFQPYASGPQQFNHPPPSTNFNYSNNESNNQSNYATGPRRNFPPPKNTFRNNFNKQENYPHGGNFAQNTYQNKNQTYNNYGYENKNMNNRQENYNRDLGTNNYQQRNISKGEDLKIQVSNGNNAQNRTVRQFCSKNEESYDQNTGNFQKEQRNRNFSNPRNRRPLSCNNSEVKIVSPEKKMKMEENNKKEESVQQIKQPTTTSNSVIDEEEDEEMRLYRQKIEEQKRERERVLKMKEERRRLTLLQQEKEKSPEKPATGPQKTNFQRTLNQPALTTLDKFTTNSQPSVEEKPPNLSFKITNNLQRKIPTVLKHDSSSGSKFLSNRAIPQPENIPPKARNFLLNRPVPTTENPHPKKDLSASNFMSNRVVVVKNISDNNVNQSGVLLNPPATVNTDSGDDASQGLSSFLNSRKILKKDNLLINTRLVVISNLSASTTENKLMAMARGIGEIQKLRMDKQERQATILFKSVATAHAFFKKYQRHMLDLSMIQVKLAPML